MKLKVLPAVGAVPIHYQLLKDDGTPVSPNDYKRNTTTKLDDSYEINHVFASSSDSFILRPVNAENNMSADNQRSVHMATNTNYTECFLFSSDILDMLIGWNCRLQLSLEQERELRKLIKDTTSHEASNDGTIDLKGLLNTLSQKEQISNIINNSKKTDNSIFARFRSFFNGVRQSKKDDTNKPGPSGTL